MKLLRLVSSALTLPLVGAYLVSPSGAVAPGAAADCSKWVQQSYAMTCAIIEQFSGMTEAQFEAWNPTVTEAGPNCTLIPELYYCVEVNFSTMSTLITGPPSASTANSSPTTTSSPIIAKATSSPLTTSTTTTSVIPTSSVTPNSSSGNSKTSPMLNIGWALLYCIFL